jgi:D-tyrosyl-tRNA(Tyr) deacylase
MNNGLGKSKGTSDAARRAVAKLVKFYDWKPTAEDVKVRQSYDRLLVALEEQRRAHEEVELRLQEYIEVLDQRFERLL